MNFVVTFLAGVLIAILWGTKENHSTLSRIVSVIVGIILLGYIFVQGAILLDPYSGM